jgi:protein-tyrosine phosphatase
MSNCPRITHCLIAGASALLLASCAPQAVNAPVASANLVATAPATATPDRVVPLERGQNFRELGGYRTSDGRRVRSGLIYRSGSMHWLTPADFGALRQRGIRTVVDFRDTRERTSEPVVWPETATPLVLVSPDPVSGNSEFSAELTRPGVSGASVRALMTRFYAEVPTRYAPHYRQLFTQLLNERAPLIFNCTAGKDRTGVAAALLLNALGVPRETVIEDYLLSNTTFNPDIAGSATANDPQAAFFRSLPQDVVRALMGVDRAYINSAFAAIEARPGGFDAYYRDVLGLDAAALTRLRTMYLEPAS